MRQARICICVESPARRIGQGPSRTGSMPLGRGVIDALLTGIRHANDKGPRSGGGLLLPFCVVAYIQSDVGVVGRQSIGGSANRNLLGELAFVLAAMMRYQELALGRAPRPRQGRSGDELRSRTGVILVSRSPSSVTLTIRRGVSHANRVIQCLLERQPILLHGCLS